MTPEQLNAESGFTGFYDMCYKQKEVVENTRPKKIKTDMMAKAGESLVDRCR